MSTPPKPKSKTKTKTNNSAKLKKALDEMYESLDTLEQARLEFGLAIYEAGNTDKASFCAAVKEAIKELHRTRSNVNFSDRTAGILFEEVVNHLKRQSAT